MSDEDPSFADLIARVRAGDDDAIARLVEKYGRVIRAVVRVRLTDLGLRRLFDSVDVCQSVLANFCVLAALGQLDLSREDQMMNLLATMARNKLANHARKQKAARRDHRRTAAAEDAEFIDPAPSPSRVVAGKELLQEVRRRLTDEEQRLAERRAQGCSWAEIAAEVGGQPDALRMQLTRAVRRVRQELHLDD
jgi:RNA polymerase sigma-70 factor (ECF subfamily)